MKLAGTDYAWRWSLGICLVVAVVVYIILGACNIFLGDLNQDEGWYLYAARQVTQGNLPYRDYAFTQAPMLPLCYASADVWVERYGVLGGRIFTAALGLVGVLLASWLAARMAPAGSRALAVAVCFILLGVNVYQSYFTVVVKTYSLCAVFLLAGLLALSYTSRAHAFVPSAVAGLFLALAAGTRLSAGAALPVVGLFLIFFSHRIKSWAWLDFGLAGLLALCAWSLPFLFLARDGFMFGMFEYHSLRSAGSLMQALVYKAGFISRLVQAYFPAFALWLLLLAEFLLARRAWQALPESDRNPPYFRLCLWGVVLAISAVHVMAPFPYDDYQVFVYPVLCALLAATASRWWAGVQQRNAPEACEPITPNRWRLGFLWAITGIAVMSAFSSPVNQAWFIKGRDRIWWRMREQAPLANLQEVALGLREFCAPGEELLTQDTYLAVEAGLTVPRGLEMGPFAFYPAFSRARATALHVVNQEMLEEIIRATPAPLAALSGYSFTIRSPEVEELSASDQAHLLDVLRERYEEVDVIPDFGQGSTELRLFMRKDHLAELADE